MPLPHLPQLPLSRRLGKIWCTRHTADISLGMYTLFTLGVALWLVYGALLESWPIAIANSITLLLAGAVLIMKLKFG